MFIAMDGLVASDFLVLDAICPLWLGLESRVENLGCWDQQPDPPIPV